MWVALGDGTPLSCTLTSKFKQKIAYILDTQMSILKHDFAALSPAEQKDKTHPINVSMKKVRAMNKQIETKLNKDSHMKSITSMLINLTTQHNTQADQEQNKDEQIGLSFPNGVLYHYADAFKMIEFHIPPPNSYTMANPTMNVYYELRVIIYYISIYNMHLLFYSISHK